MTPSRSGRAGFALVEMMIVMAIGTVLVGVLAATLSKVIAANGRASDHLEALVGMQRLAEQFRRDVHAA